MRGDGDLAQLLGELARKFQVPGCQVAVTTEFGEASAAYGIANAETGVEVTPDTVFQICSITKVWTATLVMMLVEEGRVALDDPVVNHLPTWRLADPALTSSVTVGHLLDHTSGIDGDFLLDTGRGEDALPRYLDALAGLGAVHPLGAAVSYCNSGFSVLGHLVATKDGCTFEEVLRRRLFQPLDLSTAGLFAEEAALKRVAVGHHQAASGEGWDVDRTFGIWRSQVPAGGIHASAQDLVAFARMHLDGGVAAGDRVLSASSCDAMRRSLRPVPDPLGLGKRFGIGWMLQQWGDQQVVGHDGGAFGQLSFLRVFPEAGSAVVLLTNGDGGARLWSELIAELAPEISGICPPRPWWEGRERRPAGDLADRAGRYRSAMLDMEVEVMPSRSLRLTLRNVGPEAVRTSEPDVLELLLEHVDGDLWGARLEPESPLVPVGFVGFAEAPSSLQFGSRLSPKVA